MEKHHGFVVATDKELLQSLVLPSREHRGNAMVGLQWVSAGHSKEVLGHPALPPPTHPLVETLGGTPWSGETQEALLKKLLDPAGSFPCSYVLSYVPEPPFPYSLIFVLPQTRVSPQAPQETK